MIKRGCCVLHEFADAARDIKVDAHCTFAGIERIAVKAPPSSISSFVCHMLESESYTQLVPEDSRALVEGRPGLEIFAESYNIKFHCSPVNFKKSNEIIKKMQLLGRGSMHISIPLSLDIGEITAITRARAKTVHTFNEFLKTSQQGHITSVNRFDAVIRFKRPSIFNASFFFYIFVLQEPSLEQM